MTRRERKCSAKTDYKTPLEAVFAKQRLFNNHKEIAHPYFCEICGGIHLTTEDSPQKKAREANKLKQQQKQKVRA